MSILRELSKNLADKRDSIAAGVNTYIPFNPVLWPSLSQHFYFLRGKYYIATASEKVGKTKLVKSLGVINSIWASIELGLDIDIRYYALEETSEAFHLDLFSTLLNLKTGDVLSSKLGLGITDDPIAYSKQINYVLGKTPALAAIYEKYIDGKITVIDDLNTSTAIELDIEAYASTIGKIINGKYIQNDPKKFVIIIVDHISLLAGTDKYVTVRDFSQKVMLQVVVKKFKFTGIVVQQQSSDKELIDANVTASKMVSKLRPSSSGLANCKETMRDVDGAIGLFAPFKHEIIPSLNNYPRIIGSTFLGAYRELNIIADRHFGQEGSRFNMQYMPNSRLMRQLPMANNPTEAELHFNTPLTFNI